MICDAYLGCAAWQAGMKDFEEMRYLLQCLGVAIGHRGAHGDPLAQQVLIKRGAGPRGGVVVWVEEVLG